MQGNYYAYEMMLKERRKCNYKQNTGYYRLKHLLDEMYHTLTRSPLNLFYPIFFYHLSHAVMNYAFT